MSNEPQELENRLLTIPVVILINGNINITVIKTVEGDIPVLTMTEKTHQEAIATEVLGVLTSLEEAGKALDEQHDEARALTDILTKIFELKSRYQKKVTP